MLYSEFQYILCCGSTKLIQLEKGNNQWFQYILCCGSTPILLYFFLWISNFNTSYVAVQLACLIGGQKFVYKFQYILCCGSTCPTLIVFLHFIQFQYILCCGSTYSACMLRKIIYYFNTSYVAVQPFVVIHFTFFIISKKHWSYNIFHYFFQW